MSKKKILSEAQVRRFMGLAGIQPINEMGYHSPAARDEEEEFEGEEVEMSADGMEDEMGAEEVEMSDDEEMEIAPEEEVSIDAEAIEAAREGLGAIESLLSALGGEESMEDEAPEFEEEEEEEEEEVEEMPEDGMEDEEVEEEEEEIFEGVDLQLSQTEIVNEVARRVAKRIVEAKRAQNKMNEALGRKSPAKRKPAAKRAPAKRRRNK
jgi:hypothetical protein